MPRLRYQADDKTLLALLVASSVLLMSLRWDGSLEWGLIFFAANVLAGLMSHVINHNASHCAVFEKECHNRWLFQWLSVLMGIPAAPIAASHIHNHHVHNNDENDWMRSSVLGDSVGICRLAKYIIHVFSLPRLKTRTGHEGIPLSLYARMNTEVLSVAAVVVIMLMLSPWATLYFYVLARLCAMCALFLINLVQHDGLEGESGVNRCRNFTGRWVNFFLFHNGLHSAHHLRPGLHWSELPAYHAVKVAPQLKTDLTHRSVTAFIISRYLLPSPWRRRLWN